MQDEMRFRCKIACPSIELALVLTEFLGEATIRRGRRKGKASSCSARGTPSQTAKQERASLLIYLRQCAISQEGRALSAEFQTQKPLRTSKVCAEEVQLADANDHCRQLPLFSMANNVHF